MDYYFEIHFPLKHVFGKSNFIIFNMINRGKNNLTIDEGIYFLYGENASGKSTFFSLLSLLSGDIGNQKGNLNGSINFGDVNYNSKGFNCDKAAFIREKNFNIFCQEIFFLPGLRIDQNFQCLNNKLDAHKCSIFKKILNDRRYPYTELSGGERQKAFMDTMIERKKPVWFIDEPFNNMDKEGPLILLKKIYKSHSSFTEDHDNANIIMIIDHHRFNLLIQRNEFSSTECKIFAELSAKIIKKKGSKKTEIIAIYKVQDFVSFAKTFLLFGIEPSGKGKSENSLNREIKIFLNKISSDAYKKVKGKV